MKGHPNKTNGEVPAITAGAHAFIYSVTLLGCLLFVVSLGLWQPANLANGVLYWALAIITSSVKLYLPGITGTISPGFVLVLFGIVSFDLPEALIGGSSAVIAQYLWLSTKRPRLIQALFNVGSISIAIKLSFVVFHSALWHRWAIEYPVVLTLTASLYFLLTTGSVAAAIALTERKSLVAVWKASYQWAFPYYLFGAAAVGLLAFVRHKYGWQSSLMAVPVMYVIYLAYRANVKHLENHQQQEELRRSRDVAEASNRVKSEFLAMVSHEIRTPMNGVLGMAGILLDSGLGEEQLRHARALHHSAEGLLAIINEILDLSKIESGKLAIECIPFDIQPIVEASAEVVASRANEKGIDLMVRIAPGVPRQVTGDPGRIRQILVNLLGNAVKFTSHGHVFLDVACEQPAGESVRLRFSVEDTGIGIPADKLEHIFERFTQVDSSTTRRFGGTGLGLAICRQLAELMKGSLAVESVPGKGSTFSFTVELGSAAGQETDPSGSALSGMRVLVMDDYLPTRSALLKQMEAWGARSDGFSEPVTAIEFARAAASEGRPFDAVLWNQQQGQRGTLRAHPRFLTDPVWNDVRRIMLASKPGPATEPDTGRVVHLVKPIFPSRLLAALANCSGSAEIPAGSETAQPQQSGSNAVASGAFQAHVLVADDNLINQDLARVLLERLGCKVDVADDGREAIELACSVPYDMIFMDCLMPQVDGIEATVEIRRRQLGARRQPIVALTASAMQGALELCLQAGMDDHILKPVRPQDFSRVLNRFLSPIEGVEEGGRICVRSSFVRRAMSQLPAAVCTTGPTRGGRSR